MPSIAENYEKIRENLRAACRRSGRQETDVRLMAVTKTQPLEKVQELYALGHRLFGENRIGEGWEKRQHLPADVEMHMIGQLQSNKAREALFFDCIHSLDRKSLAQELEKRLITAGQTMKVLLEVNTGGEDQKAGIRQWDDVVKLTEYLRKFCPHIEIQGLMTMAPFTQDEQVLRQCFRTLRTWRDRLQGEFPDNSWTTLSMGMSNDFTIAIEEGSTLVRVGTKFFEN